MILQALVIIFIALIAYWWANQGAFSALLHLTCVILAGAMTLAFWEPISVSLLGKLGDHTWSVVFLGLFAGFLLVFRVAFDRLVPGNLNFPQSINYVVGGTFGALAGLLTVGMLILGMGFTQSLSSLMEFYGVTRLAEERGQPFKSESLWVPAHEITTGFFGMLSAGSLSPVTATSLKKYYPDLANSALSLHRDSWGSGRGKTSVAPSAVQVGSFGYDPDFEWDSVGGATPEKGAFSLRLTFDVTAFDRGQGLTLSAAQAKLVGQSSRGGATVVMHPRKYAEEVAGGDRGTFDFDSIQNYATNPAGQQSADVDLIFPATGLDRVDFAMVKGLRLRLPQPTVVSIGEQVAAAESESRVAAMSSDGAPELSSSDLAEGNSLQPLQLGINQASGLTLVEDKKGNWVESGKGKYKKAGTFSVSRSQRINGFVQPPGTAIVRLDLTRGQATVDLEELRKLLPPGAPVRLVDAENRAYSATGYLWDMGTEVQIMYDPVGLVEKLKDFPGLSSGGTQKLWAIFVVPMGATLKQVRIGDSVVGAAELTTKGEN